jgi:hypothetical protein
MHSMASDPWHFPRTALARSYLRHFKAGTFDRLALFARRRMGKTQFLLRDLAPEAIAMGYVPVYIDLWSARENMASRLAEELSALVSEKSPLFRGLKKLKVEFGSEILGKIGVEGEVERSAKQPAAATPGLKPFFEAAVQSISEGKTPGQSKILLMFDEVQVLAEQKHRAEAFIAELREMLQRYAGSVCCVFTGASRDGLARLFKAKNASLYNFSTEFDLPSLEQEFVGHVVGVFEEHYGPRKIDRSALLKIYNDSGCSPWIVREVVNRLLTDITDDVVSVKKRLDEQYNSGAYESTWRELTNLDRIVLIALASGVSKPYAMSALKLMNSLSAEHTKALGLSHAISVLIPSVQKTIDRLRTNGLVAPLGRTREYEIDDFEFHEWMGQRFGAEIRNGREQLARLQDLAKAERAKTFVSRFSRRGASVVKRRLSSP